LTKIVLVWNFPGDRNKILIGSTRNRIRGITEEKQA
jgi:hypothetical protein